MFWPREPYDFCQAGDIVEGYVSPLRDVPLALEVEEAETDRESVPAAAPAARAARTPDHWLRCSHVEEIIHDMLDEVEEIVDERAVSCHNSGEEGDEEDCDGAEAKDRRQVRRPCPPRQPLDASSDEEPDHR